MARARANRLPAGGLAVGLVAAMLSLVLVASPSLAGSSAQTVVPISGSVAPLALLRVENGAQLVVRVGEPGQGGASRETVVSFPKALRLQVIANAPWKLTVASAGEFPVQVRLSAGATGGPVQVRTDGAGAVGAYGQAGQLRLTWDVTVVVPPGTPEGVYAVPLMVELTTV